GVGLTGHVAHRIVTERSRIAMPEVRIGIVPDVGGHLLLSKAPGRLGEYLAITAAEMGAGDAIALGFADAYVPSTRLGELREALAHGGDIAGSIVRHAEEPPASRLIDVQEWFDPIADSVLGEKASRTTLDDPIRAAQELIAALEGSSH